MAEHGHMRTWYGSSVEGQELGRLANLFEYKFCFRIDAQDKRECVERSGLWFAEGGKHGGGKRKRGKGYT